MSSFEESQFGIPPVSEGEETNPQPHVPSSSRTGEPSEGQTSSRKRTSTVWNEFDRVMVEGVWKAKCKKCAKLYSCSSSGGTGHLKRHQESHRMHDSHAQTQSSLNIQGGLLVGNFAYNHENQRKALVKWIVKDELPFSLCESFNFEEYVQLNLQPAYKRTSRRTFRRVAMTNFLAMKQNLIETLSTLNVKISLTSDIWSASVGSNCFIAITAHYIDNDWQLNKRILAFRAFDFPHSGQQISNIIYQTACSYNINDKIMSITFDNASNNNSAVVLLKDSLHPILDGNLLHIRCACHILNLSVQAGMGMIQDVISKIRNAVSFIHASRSRLQEFKELCINHGKRFKKFKLDVITRWNSTYSMIHDAYPYKNLLSAYINDRGLGFTLTETDWNKGKILEDFLLSFYNATNVLSGIYYPTSCSFLQQAYIISQKFAEHRYDDVLMPIIDLMESKWNEYWDKICPMHNLAAVFDPRVKLNGVLILLDAYAENMNQDAESAKDEVRQLLYDIYAIYDEKIRGSRTQIQTSISSSSSSRSSSIFSFIAQRRHTHASSSSSSSSSLSSELEFYLRNDLQSAYDENQIESLDVLSWWKSVRNQYPVMSAIARDILAVPMSTVASESAFSAGRRVLDEKRSRMTGETVEMLLCFKDWLDAEARLQDKGGHNTTSSDDDDTNTTED